MSDEESILASTVIGYHGTSKSRAAKIVSEGFKISENPYDWLGDGIYFFQDAPQRAWEWARKAHGSDSAVVGARIENREWIDLLDIRWASFLAAAYDSFLGKLQASGISLPLQSTGAHRLDREVINYAIGVLQEKGQVIRAVRGAFAEGAPVFPNSALLTRSHVQIAVRDMDLIIDYWPESEASE